MSDDEIGYEIPPPVRISTAQGDPNFTVTDKPHGDVIADKLRTVVASADSSPEERQQAESLLSQFWGKPNSPHDDVINGANTLTSQNIDKMLPDILEGRAEGWVSVEPSNFAISPQGGIARSKQAEDLLSGLEKEVEQLEREQSQEDNAMKKEIGSIVVTENGNVVLLTSLDNQGDLRPGGAVDVFDYGVVLKGTTVELGIGVKIPYPSSNNVRVVAHINQALELLEHSGVNLKTRPEKALSQLGHTERLERLEKTTK
jgi:hypothetical protein